MQYRLPEYALSVKAEDSHAHEVEAMNEREIFANALQMETDAERSAYLDEACAGDTEMRRSIEALLREQQDLGSFLESPADDGDIARTLDQPIPEKAGAQIGLFKLLQELGEGGMGVVYMAEQIEPVERRVALKIIKPGMDSRQVIARFEAERQALAMMDHPNIAKVLDGGTTGSGRPYFVMELVKGISITKYCDQHQLTPKERLELFMPVCHAVQHAHQKGIIHRDLKPSNILVARYDDQAVPKVIDFGVAKATAQRLTEKTMFTEFGQIVGTLEYMSPEQAQVNELDIDTRSDVYSLGVLLYELLTGATPFDRQRLRSAAFDEMLRIIREEEPPRPSTRLSTIETLPSVAANRHVEAHKLSTMLRGELDWIVMKAIEKDRSRRYETAIGFAEDIERYLNDEPVVACPPSALYRFKKFARRNKALLTTVTMVAVTLLLGAVVSTSQAIRASRSATRERLAHQEANERRDEAVEAKGRVEEANREIEKKNKEISHQLASICLDRGHSLCEQGEIGRGMTWLARGLHVAPDDAGDLQRAARANLAAWNAHLHRLRMVIQAPEQVGALAMSPDGTRIVTGGVEGTIRLWDAATGQPTGKSAWQEGPIQTVVFDPVGSRFVVGGEGGARLWNAATLEPIGQLLEHPGSVIAAAFNPDGSQLITGGNGGTIGYWDPTTGKPTRAPIRNEDSEEVYEVVAVRFTPQGLRAAVVAQTKNWRGGTKEGVKPTKRWWLVDGETGKQVGPLVKCETFVFGAAISPDGSWFATAGSARIRLWDTATGLPAGSTPTTPILVSRALQTIMHRGSTYAVAFSPDSSQLISGGNNPAARIWDVATRKPVGAPLRQRSTVRAVAFSPDGTQMLTASEDGAVCVWELGSRHPEGQVVQHEDTVTGVAFSRDGLRMTTVRDGISLFRDGVTGKPLGGPYDLQGPSSGALMFFSRDNSQMLRGRWFRHLIDLVSGECLLLQAGDPVRDAAYSPDGSRVLTGLKNGSVVLWDASSGDEIARCETNQGELNKVAFRTDGARFVTGSANGMTQLWETATLEAIGEPIQHQSGIKALVYGANDDQLFVGCADTVRLWDLAKRRPIGPLLEHQDVITAVALSPDGSRLLTRSRDQTGQIWDASTLRPIGPRLQLSDPWARGCFSPDGSQLLLSNPTRGGQLLDAPPGPWEGEKEQIVLWTQLVTGLELDATGRCVALAGSVWLDRHRELQRRGGPPATASLPVAPRLETDFTRAMDVALRGWGLGEEGRWGEAAAAFAEAIQVAGNTSSLRVRIGCWCRKLSEGLAGTKIELTGTTTDGTPFDLEAYRGSVVWVVFWAGSPDSQQYDIAHVLRKHESYHERGFVVVGVRGDDDLRGMEQHEAANPVPWIALPASQFNSSFPLTRFYMESNGPVAILVDKAGEVASARFRGPEFEAVLQRLLGPAAAEDKTPAPDG